MRTSGLLLTFVAGLFLLPARETLAGKPGGGAPPADPAIACWTQTTKGAAVDRDLVVMNADGTNRRILVDGTTQRFSGPDWSPDGTRLTFLSDVQGPGVYVVNVDGTGLAKVIAVDATTDPDFWWSSAPRWSPAATADGQSKIAYVTTHAGGTSKALWVVNLDGTGAAQLTTAAPLSQPLRGVTSIAWSPDAGAVAVGLHDDDGREDVVVHGLGLVGGALAIASTWNVTDDASVPGGTLNAWTVKRPCWSRAGSRLAVDAFLQGGYIQVWIIDLANPASPARVTPGTLLADQSAPCWSPDDSKLVVKTGGDLYTIHADGSGLTRITNGKSSSGPSFTFPVWRRNP